LWRQACRTLPQLSGQPKVRIGVLADLHIPPLAQTSPLPKRAKRLYAVAEELAFKYLKRMETQGVDLVIFPGDTLDPGDDYTLGVARDLFRSVRIPCYPILGNHETYGPIREPDFFRAFGLPKEGYHAFTHNQVRFILLNTPDQGRLNPRGAQFQWLQNELDRHGNELDTLIFSHFSLLLHPCVRGWKNDGMQQCDHAQAVLDLFRGYSQIRAFLAGHKNVPSRLLHQGVLHLLCPQLIQAPCSYNTLTLFDDGLQHNVFEIEEQHYAQISRNAFSSDYPERYGQESDRNYVWPWPDRTT
jgi:3',5'-cyclic AMP phosphodiesterase CpdA